MPVTITRKALNGFAVGAAVAIALSACSPSDGAENTSSTDSNSPSSQGSQSATSKESSTAASPTTKSASPTPVAASSNGPAKNWPVPKMPAAAKKHTLEGAGAFSKYYFDLLEYTTWTNDSKQVAAISTSDCVVCRENIIQPANLNQKEGGWNVGGDYSPTIASAQGDGPDRVWVAFKFVQKARTVFDSKGQISTEYVATKKPRVGSFSLLWSDGWKLDSVDLTDS